MTLENLALVRGIGDTRDTLQRWNRAPWPVLRGWLVGALAITVALLTAVAVIAALSTPDATPIILPGLNAPADLAAVGEVLRRNALVLALHGFACIAGFIAGSSMPLEAERHSGLVRRVHDLAGPLALGFVGVATTFSLVTQAYTLGSAASTLAALGGMDSTLLLVGLLPHALPELVALFLPLAAWMIASRRGAWSELLAATVVTCALAIPVLVVAAFVEVYVSPDVILLLRG
jgi:Stage II sporulation protein M